MNKLNESNDRKKQKNKKNIYETNKKGKIKLLT